ncbi:glucose 1-dehydrogenase [Pollutibacter soli]|uniref:SDR family NAD(P)-dependent oxidoreductase n=1 Tax=Pollutibacter soli TaxID=3034157 RepID=UPI003013276A
MKRLTNKTAIVTGAAGGIGAATAKLFVEEGANVLATDRHISILEDWVNPLKKTGAAIEALEHDVADVSQWEKVINTALKKFNHINILVNNAGIFPGFVNCEETSLGVWNNVIATNLTGPFLGCQACIPHMRINGGGAIINIASIAGLVGGNGVAYSASKGGLRLLSKDLAVTLAKDKIRVNTICPGAVLTPMTAELVSKTITEDIIKNGSPQGRMASAQEIAWGVLYLASDESSFVTGTDLVIDGGAVAR